MDGATNVDQVQRKEEFWLFCDTIMMNVHPTPKGIYNQENQKIHQIF